MQFYAFRGILCSHERCYLCMKARAILNTLSKYLEAWLVHILYFNKADLVISHRGGQTHVLVSHLAHHLVLQIKFHYCNIKYSSLYVFSVTALVLKKQSWVIAWVISELRDGMACSSTGKVCQSLVSSLGLHLDMQWEIKWLMLLKHSPNIHPTKSYREPILNTRSIQAIETRSLPS